MISPLHGESELEEYSKKASSDGVFFIFVLIGSFIGTICLYHNKRNSDWTVMALLPTLLTTLIFAFVIGSKINTVSSTGLTAKFYLENKISHINDCVDSELS